VSRASVRSREVGDPRARSLTLGLHIEARCAQVPLRLRHLDARGVRDRVLTGFFDEPVPEILGTGHRGRAFEARAWTRVGHTLLDGSLSLLDASLTLLEGPLSLLDASLTPLDGSLSLLDASLTLLDASLTLLDASLTRGCQKFRVTGFRGSRREASLERPSAGNSPLSKGVRDRAKGTGTLSKVAANRRSVARCLRSFDRILSSVTGTHRKVRRERAQVAASRAKGGRRFLNERTRRGAPGDTRRRRAQIRARSMPWRRA
jgi:hypothetical protein